MKFSLPHLFMAMLVAVTLLPATVTRAAEPASGPDPALLAKTVDRAIEYLRTRGQSPEGAFSPQTGPAVTALVTTAALRHGRRQCCHRKSRRDGTDPTGATLRRGRPRRSSPRPPLSK